MISLVKPQIADSLIRESTFSSHISEKDFTESSCSPVWARFIRNSCLVVDKWQSLTFVAALSRPCRSVDDELVG
jgi:hypothetical protein